ncbi:hypothetical protein B0T22DRAFT_129140 [Podospora appendiculata]|uniref:Secreted protein n=1 Tax=Podospora appendiculata TaxID=314037 RepID=A0AAE1CBF7_9PEZI|nr:hypothetical protein B0T22DRAFT_129140 [Podospora appendiculata]
MGGWAGTAWIMAGRLWSKLTFAESPCAAQDTCQKKTTNDYSTLSLIPFTISQLSGSSPSTMKVMKSHLPQGASWVGRSEGRREGVREGGKEGRRGQSTRIRRATSGKRHRRNGR